jgi:hypothetical protein
LIAGQPEASALYLNVVQPKKTGKATIGTDWRLYSERVVDSMILARRAYSDSAKTALTKSTTRDQGYISEPPSSNPRSSLL